MLVLLGISYRWGDSREDAKARRGCARKRAVCVQREVSKKARPGKAGAAISKGPINPQGRPKNPTPSRLRARQKMPHPLQRSPRRRQNRFPAYSRFVHGDPHGRQAHRNPIRFRPPPLRYRADLRLRPPQRPQQPRRPANFPQKGCSLTLERAPDRFRCTRSVTDGQCG